MVTHERPDPADRGGETRDTEIARLAAEVYGDGVPAFMATPRRSLGMRTPAEAIAAGDFDGVRNVLINALEGHFD